MNHSTQNTLSANPLDQRSDPSPRSAFKNNCGGKERDRIGIKFRQTLQFAIDEQYTGDLQTENDIGKCHKILIQSNTELLSSVDSPTSSPRHLFCKENKSESPSDLDSPSHRLLQSRSQQSRNISFTRDNSYRSALVLRTPNSKGSKIVLNSGLTSPGNSTFSQIVDGPLRITSSITERVFSDANADAEEYKDELRSTARSGIIGQESNRSAFRQRIKSNIPAITEDRSEAALNNESRRPHRRAQQMRRSANHTVTPLRSIHQNQQVLIQGPPSRSNETVVPIQQISQTQARPIGQNAVNTESQNSNQNQSSFRFNEASLTLNRAIAVSAIICLLSLVAKTSFNTNFYISILVCIYTSAFLLLVESLFGACNRNRQSWRCLEDSFGAVDYLCILLFFGMVHIKMTIGRHVASIVCLPFICNMLIYGRKSKAPTSAFIFGLLMRVYRIVIVCVATLTLDGVFNCSWTTVCCLMALHCIFLIRPLLSNLLGVLAVILDSIIQCKLVFLEPDCFLCGRLCFILHHSAQIVTFMTLFALASVLDGYGDSATMMSEYAMYTCYISGSAVVASILTYKRAIEYIKSLSDSSDRAQSAVVPHKNEDVFIFHTEKKESYFVMISNTYFRPMDERFFAKNKEHLKVIKRKIASARLKIRPKFDQKSPNESTIILNKESWIQYKETLDHKFARILEGGDVPALIKRSTAKNAKSVSMQEVVDIEMQNQNEASFVIAEKNHLSAEDLDYFEKDRLVKSNAVNEDERLCYLCYSNPSNAILLNCRHGGICYACASTSVQKKNECMQCRKEVRAIYRTSTARNPFGIVKGVELVKLTTVKN